MDMSAQRASLVAPARLPRDEQELKWRLEKLADQTARYPLPVLAGAAFVSTLVWNYVSPEIVAAWVLGLGVILLIRWQYCKRARLARDHLAVRTALRTLLVLSLVHGTITGLSVVLFFHRLPPDFQAIFSMVIVCWSAGAISANAAYRPAFYAYVVPILTPLAVAWAGRGTVEGVGVGILVVMFLIIQAWLARTNNDTLTTSFAMQFTNLDLIEQLEQEQTKTRFERDRAEAANLGKSRFIAAASHDLRQPLFSVNLLAGALQSSAEPRTRIIAGSIGLAIDAVERQINGLLDISRLDTGDIKPRSEPVMLRSIVDEIVEIEQPFASKKGLKLESEVERALRITTDRELLRRVLGNLVHNAINYTTKRDEKAGEGPGGVTVASRQMPGGGIAVDVRDTGCGIAAEELDRIFQRFYRVEGAPTRAARGLGLGLAVVHEVTELLGLEVRVDSTPGVGSTFSVVFPSEKVEMLQLPSAPVAAVHPSAPRRDTSILVLDDDADVRNAFVQLLQTWGYRAVGAESGPQALRMVDDHVPDVVLADYHLGEQDDGIRVLERLRAVHGPIPALIVTSDSSLVARHDAASGIPVLAKSVASDVLNKKIAELLERSAPVERLRTRKRRTDAGAPAYRRARSGRAARPGKGEP